MDKLNALERSAKWNADNFEPVTVAGTKDILAIAEAFRELEQRAEAAETVLERESDIHIDTAASMREWRLRAEAAEAQLAELAKQKAAGFVNAPGKAKLFYHGEGLPVDTRLFTSAAPAAVPVDLVPTAIPKDVYKVIYDECGGFVDTTANAQHIWAYCRMTILRQLEERQC